MSAPIPAPSIESLFANMTADDVHAMVGERRGEHLTLDFKTAPSNFASRDERRILAIAMSGFANSNGGLIVWGVEAKKDDADGVDCAQRAVPIENPDLFMSNLKSHSSQAASPAVASVQHRLLDGPRGTFAVTYIPESDGGPHMAKLGEDRFYQRIGDTFHRMESYAIGDMFGRRPRPRLRLHLTREDADNTLLVALTNDGRGTAKAPFLSLELPPNFRPSPYGYDGNGTWGMRRGGWAYGRCDFGGDTTTVVHPKQRLLVTKIEATVRTPDGTPVIRGPQTFRYELAAEDIPLETGEVVIDY